MSNHPQEEKTYLMVKPDGVRRGLTGEILKRIERADLKIIALSMFQPTHQQIDDHYPKDEKWINRLGEKTKSTYEKYGFDLKGEMGTEDTLKIGKEVRKWLIDYMVSAPLVKVIVQGNHAVDLVRKMVGNTMPAVAEMGTIRGDFSADSAAAANRDKRAVHNIVHASETPQEAAHEIEHWFGVDEICSYKRVEDSLR
ncbi:nucleoside-diphosphate kinase [Candidatus Falkowbacteria bacterium RIFOXYB2_FULL_47_14]|uniref:nucleoside-diphosphate kinase n=1 Tax=Candidatus Falkowbacteria bacterium RIFOXYA2_FULL_47_19 TaxID=1797994 RepID=A0A1F5SJK6_9BACT|nr:MAG: nucleoside-diphosphate kinase [Candidatus Falkowbacteria bacterium RIFOXYA2_FULL_47_19]OGF35922.1 MAG: nucleoside-diphosphate kinase [Candidatus Falkowbacteria bacterium RIFOXYC2_FULL_46_15]OGF43940.1 MAG: nucleoside-diphosphate kinase [Candidatus Falkowbacteria bacterium RIFOXYB2_FULL_47_14]